MTESAARSSPGSLDTASPCTPEGGRGPGCFGGEITPTADECRSIRSRLGWSLDRLAEADCWAEALLAREARDALAVSVQEQVEIATPEDNPPDRVRIFVNGRSLSRRMIEKGLVVPTPDAWNGCGPLDTSTARPPQLNHRIRDAAGLAPSQSPGQEGDRSDQEKAP
ncbi:MAG: hypothetical protein KY449_08435 [Proteobacteria bacterium]|nr:hypothetical protein [Pseudomonadota bacterium]